MEIDLRAPDALPAKRGALQPVAGSRATLSYYTQSREEVYDDVPQIHVCGHGLLEVVGKTYADLGPSRTGRGAKA